MILGVDIGTSSMKLGVFRCSGIDKWEKVFHDLESERGIKAIFIPE